MCALPGRYGDESVGILTIFDLLPTKNAFFGFSAFEILMASLVTVEAPYIVLVIPEVIGPDENALLILCRFTVREKSTGILALRSSLRRALMRDSCVLIVNFDCIQVPLERDDEGIEPPGKSVQ